MNVQYLILTVGLPASGKSTWADEYCAYTLETVQVERDQIRIEENLPFGTDEDRVTDIQRRMIYCELNAGNDVVVSDLNLSPKYRNKLVNWAKQRVPDVQVRYKLFTDVPLLTCIERNKLRPNSTRIPEQTIRDLYYNLIVTNKFMTGIRPEEIMQ